MMNYLRNFIRLFLVNMCLLFLDLILPTYCLNTFIKSFLDFLCKESIIKLNDKIYIILF